MLRFRIWYSALPTVIRWLLTVNVGAYLLWVLVVSHIPLAEQFVWNHLALHAVFPAFLVEPWQLVTYNFLHLGDYGASGLSLGSMLHVAINMLWLYWIGRYHEEAHGSQQILALYLLTGIGGALASILVYSVFASGAAVVVIHGASAAVLGVVMAVAVMYPQRKIYLLFLGPVRLLYLVIAFLAFDVLFRMGGGTAVVAHCGGALSGFLFVRLEARGVDLSSWTRIFLQKRITPAGGWLARLERLLGQRSKRERISHRAGKSTRVSPAQREKRQVTSSDVDRVLDKISAHGMESLTEEDRNVLEEASRQ